MESINVNDTLHSLYYNKFPKNGYVLPKYYTNSKESIDNFEVYNDDVWVCSFPRTGTTWTQEMVWLIGNQLDYKKAEESLTKRFPFLELSLIYDGKGVSDHQKNSIKFVKEMARPRFIKTHLPWSLLPKQIQTGERKPKIVYIARNPKDTCVSYYHHTKLFLSTSGDLKSFVNDFLHDEVGYTPFWKNVLSYWNNRHLENVHFIKYEEMITNLKSIVLKSAEFLEVNINSNELEKLLIHLSFNLMKNNKAVNFEEDLLHLKKLNLSNVEGSFIRLGKSGTHKEELDQEQIENFDKWIEINIKETDYQI